GLAMPLLRRPRDGNRGETVLRRAPSVCAIEGHLRPWVCTDAARWTRRLCWPRLGPTPNRTNAPASRRRGGLRSHVQGTVTRNPVTLRNEDYGRLAGRVGARMGGRDRLLSGRPRRRLLLRVPGGLVGVQPSG